MRCSSSSASACRPSLRASSARALSSRIAVRMSLMLWGSRRFIASPFWVERRVLSPYPSGGLYPHSSALIGRLLVLLVVAHHVAGVLAQEALDALAELLRPAHVLLHHPVFARLQVLRRRERRYFPGLFVVERHIRYQVADDGKGPQRGDCDG